MLAAMWQRLAAMQPPMWCTQLRFPFPVGSRSTGVWGQLQPAPGLLLGQLWRV
jgi:hypothetical protein